MKVPFNLIFLTFLGLYPSFNFINATKQNYHGGIPSAGYGTRYTIVLRAKTDYTHLSFDGLYVDHAQLNLHIKDKNGYPKTQFSRGDTLYLYAMKHIQTNNKGDVSPVQQWVKAKFPIDFKGQAVLRYYLNSKERYLKIKKLVKLKSENRP